MNERDAQEFLRLLDAIALSNRSYVLGQAMIDDMERLIRIRAAVGLRATRDCPLRLTALSTLPVLRQLKERMEASHPPRPFSTGIVEQFLLVERPEPEQSALTWTVFLE